MDRYQSPSKFDPADSPRALEQGRRPSRDSAETLRKPRKRLDLPCLEDRVSLLCEISGWDPIQCASVQICGVRKAKHDREVRPRAVTTHIIPTCRNIKDVEDQTIALLERVSQRVPAKNSNDIDGRRCAYPIPDCVATTAVYWIIHISQ